MTATPTTPENQQYIINGLRPEMLQDVAALVVGLGAQLEPFQTSDQTPSAIQTVDLDDFYAYAENSAHTDLEKQRYPIAVRQLWRRSQQLCAAREAHGFGTELIVTSSYRRQALPHLSPLDFATKPTLSNPDTMDSDDWHDWSTMLDKLKVDTIKAQLARVALHTRGQVNPFGLGIGASRTAFLAAFVNRLD